MWCTHSRLLICWIMTRAQGVAEVRSSRLKFGEGRLRCCPFIQNAFYQSPRCLSLDARNTISCANCAPESGRLGMLSDSSPATVYSLVQRGAFTAVELASWSPHTFRTAKLQRV